LLAALAASAGAQATGHISGRVRIGSSPVANARAVLDTARELRTDSSGRFQFRDVAVGRHALSVIAIGATPYRVNVIVTANDTLDFDVALVRAVVLDSVLVEGNTVRQEFARAYEERKRVGLGKFLDSTDVRRFSAVYQALMNVPGVKYFKDPREVRFTDNFGVLCTPNLWIDMQNWGIDIDMLRMIRPDDVAGIEVYARDILIPGEFKARGVARGCGALVIWTKRFWPQAKGKPPLR
jgi:hypothetical protein